MRKKRICGAIAKRTGKPCRCKLLYPNGRCRYHGGLSTGPRTAEGKRRALANLKQYRTQEVTVDSPAPRHPGQT